MIDGPYRPAVAAFANQVRLRSWQEDALRVYEEKMAQQLGKERPNIDFLAVATPGAGKTTFALYLAAKLMCYAVVKKLIIVCPTEHLKNQWADAAARFGLQIDPAFSNSQQTPGADFDGVAVTYAQVGANPMVHSKLTKQTDTLVILDEIHHAGDALTWGDGVELAYKGAKRRLALTGTPFRSDTAKIPFVTYQEEAPGVLRSRADFTYGYGDALAQGIVRPVIFLSYSGQMRWKTSQGQEIEAHLGQPLSKELTAQAWRTALDSKGQWIPAVLRAADKRLSLVRNSVPDAGGLVIASDQKAARAYSAQLGAITGQSPTVVLSDDTRASEKIDEFSRGTQRWMIAVRMVSEGVDVPRLSVGVYATSASTPLFFAQAIGRFVRARTRGETASIFLPSVRPLLELAANLELERDHSLKLREEQNEDEIAYREANTQQKASDELLKGFEALEAQAEFDQVLFEGTSFGTSAPVGTIEEQEYLGIPGLLEPAQVATLLRARQAKQISKREVKTIPVSDHRARAQARKELSKLVSVWALRSNTPHAQIHAELRRKCGGPEVARASTVQIQQRIDKLRDWFVGKHK